MPYADAGFSYGDHGAGFEILMTLFEHADQNIGELLPFSPSMRTRTTDGPAAPEMANWA